MNSAQKNQVMQKVSPQSLFIWSSIIGVAFSWIFWDFLQRQFRFAIEKQADWGHTLVIPFIAGYFVWMCRAQLLEAPFKRAHSGMLLMIFGLFAYTFCALSPDGVFRHHNLMGFGVGCTLGGFMLFIFGWRAMRYLWFPLLYVFIFSQTISDRLMEVVTFKLQDIASIGSYYGLSFLGLDVSRAGNTLEILYGGVSYPLNIAEACSGMRMLMAFLALGVAMAYTSLPYAWQRISLVFLALPTAVFVNILRVMTLGLLSIADSGFAAGNFHTFIGTLWLIPAFFIYLGIVWILKNVIIEEEEQEEENEPEHRTMFYCGSLTVGFVSSLVLLLTAAIGFKVAVASLNVSLQKEAVYPRKDFAIIPSKIGDWHSVGEDVRYDAAGVEALGTGLYLTRIYHNNNSSTPAIQLHLAYYTGQVDAVPHVPDRCMVAGGYVPLTPEPRTLDLAIDAINWNTDSLTLDDEPYQFVWSDNSITGKQEKIRLPIGDLQLRTTQFSHPRLADGHVFAGYFFIANGKTTPYPERIRVIAYDPFESHAFYCKVQFTMQGDRNFNIEDFTQIVSEFTSKALPEIMKCIPDWTEVRQRNER